MIVDRQHASVGSFRSCFLLWQYFQWSHLNATLFIARISCSRSMLWVLWEILPFLRLFSKCRVTSIIVVASLIPFELNVSFRVVSVRFLNHRRYLPLTMLLPFLVLVSPILLLLLFDSDPKLDLIHILLLFHVLDWGQSQLFWHLLLKRSWHTFVRGWSTLKLWDQLHILNVFSGLPILLITHIYWSILLILLICTLEIVLVLSGNVRRH